MSSVSPKDRPAPPLLELRDVGKDFGSVIALDGISTAVRAGEVTCVLGDNGAGKSTLIKVLAGVHRPDRGEVLLDGAPVSFGAPREALDAGIASVYQDLATIPLMAIWRNFFLGAEPTRGWGPFRRFDAARARETTRRELAAMGIDIRDADQPVGTLSGGER
jgi:simple sugar transport system ATP-binding protein